MYLQDVDRKVLYLQVRYSEEFLTYVTRIYICKSFSIRNIITKSLPEPPMYEYTLNSRSNRIFKKKLRTSDENEKAKNVEKIVALSWLLHIFRAWVLTTTLGLEEVATTCRAA